MSNLGCFCLPSLFYYCSHAHSFAFLFLAESDPEDISPGKKRKVAEHSPDTPGSDTTSLQQPEEQEEQLEIESLSGGEEEEDFDSYSGDSFIVGEREEQLDQIREEEAYHHTSPSAASINHNHSFNHHNINNNQHKNNNHHHIGINNMRKSTLTLN